MSMFVGDPARRPSALVVVVGALGAAALIGLMSMLPALTEGRSIAEALAGVFLARNFWLRVALPVVVFSVLMVFVVFPLLRRFALAGTGPMRGNRRTLYLATGSGVLSFGIVGWAIWSRVAEGMTIYQALSDVILAVILGVFTLAMLVWAWLTQSGDLDEAARTGDLSRVLDERHRHVAMRSAHSALSIALAALFILGSAADILVYHVYPARTFIEVGALFLVWQAAYTYWEKRL